MDSAEIISKLADLLWVGGLAATPLALLVGGLCRCKGLRPATRHMLWFTVLISFVTPAFGALIWTPHWFRSDRVIAAADAVLPHADLTVDDSRSLNAIPAGPDAPELTVVGRDKIETVVPKSRPAASPSLDSQPAPHRAFAARRPAPLVTADPSPSIGAASIESPVSGQFTADVAPAPATVIEPTPTVWTDAPAFTTKNVEVPADLAATPTGPLASDPTTQPTSPTDAAAPSEAALPSAPASLPFTTQTANQPTSDLRAWLVRLLSVRDALAALPRVPSSLWFAGAFLLLSLTLSRALLARRLIRRSAPASPDVQILVRQVGATLGLTRTPTAVFVDDPVSPMIWCGLRPLLVLPPRSGARLMKTRAAPFSFMNSPTSAGSITSSAGSRPPSAHSIGGTPLSGGPAAASMTKPRPHATHG